MDITNPVESWKRLITTPGQGHRARKVLFSLISNHSGVHRLCSRPSKETLISQPNPAWLLCYSWSSSLATISFSFCHGYSIANPFLLACSILVLLFLPLLLLFLSKDNKSINMNISSFFCVNTEARQSILPSLSTPSSPFRFLFYFHVSFFFFLNKFRYLYSFSINYVSYCLVSFFLYFYPTSRRAFSFSIFASLLTLSLFKILLFFYFTIFKRSRLSISIF